jgi:hypothetical protein
MTEGRNDSSLAYGMVAHPRNLKEKRSAVMSFEFEPIEQMIIMISIKKSALALESSRWTAGYRVGTGYTDYTDKQKPANPKKKLSIK